MIRFLQTTTAPTGTSLIASALSASLRASRMKYSSVKSSIGHKAKRLGQNDKRRVAPFRGSDLFYLDAQHHRPGRFLPILLQTLGAIERKGQRAAWFHQVLNVGIAQYRVLKPFL